MWRLGYLDNKCSKCDWDRLSSFWDIASQRQKSGARLFKQVRLFGKIQYMLLMIAYICCRSEWMYLRAMSHCRCFNSAMYLTSGKIIMLATFITYVFLGNTATPSAIFTSLALFDILRSSVGLLLPWGIQHLEDVLKAIRRIEVRRIPPLMHTTRGLCIE